MRNLRPIPPIPILAWVLLAFVAGGASVAQVARVDVGPSGLSFSPLGDAASLVLTVSGAGHVIQQELEGGGGAFKTTDLEGNQLPDGTYKWEIRAIPEARSLDSGDFAHGRSSKDGGSVKPGRTPPAQVQSGSFTILDGSIVDPNAEEPEPVRPEKGSGHAEGDLSAGGTKNFAVVDPADAGRAIYFAALEGPEAGTYIRGTARIEAGEAVVELPAYFAKMTEADGLTAHLTPVGGWSRLYVDQLSPERLVVRDAGGADGIEFSYLIQGVRKGYAGYAVERPADSLER